MGAIAGQDRQACRVSESRGQAIGFREAPVGARVKLIEKI
jgi:hypothetical protein